MGLPCVTRRTESATGGGTQAECRERPAQSFSRSLWPSSARGVRRCSTLQRRSVPAHRACPLGSSPRPGCPEILLGHPQIGSAATWLTFVSSRSGGHGPKAPTANQSLGCPVWSRLLQVNKDPQQTGCSEGLESPPGAEGKGQPSFVWTRSAPRHASARAARRELPDSGAEALGARELQKSLRGSRDEGNRLSCLPACFEQRADTASYGHFGPDQLCMAGT